MTGFQGPRSVAPAAPSRAACRGGRRASRCRRRCPGSPCSSSGVRPASRRPPCRGPRSHGPRTTATSVDGPVHVAVLGPVRVEGGRLVRDVDVVDERRDDRVVPRRIDLRAARLRVETLGVVGRSRHGAMIPAAGGLRPGADCRSEEGFRGGSVASRWCWVTGRSRSGVNRCPVFRFCASLSRKCHTAIP